MREIHVNSVEIKGKILKINEGERFIDLSLCYYYNFAERGLRLGFGYDDIVLTDLTPQASAEIKKTLGFGGVQNKETSKKRVTTKKK